MTLAENILQCRLNGDWSGVVQCWKEMDPVEQSMHTLENGDVYASYRMATREADRFAMMLNADHLNAQTEIIREMTKGVKWLNEKEQVVG